MFGLFKSKNSYEQAAKTVYARILENTRNPIFYAEYQVPDTFDGRFDLLLLHIYLVLQVMIDEGHEDAEAFNQALFDETFRDMDQTLREMGIGDMGIPKHMRKMMRAFNGRMHAYSAGMKDGDFKGALAKNLYGTVQKPEPLALEMMEKSAYEMLSALKMIGAKQISEGVIDFERMAGDDAA